MHAYDRLSLLTLSAVGLLLAACSTSRRAPAEPAPERSRARLIVIADLERHQYSNMLDLVQSRLPVGSRQGRFDTANGITSTCLYSRRSSRGVLDTAQETRRGLSGCPMLAVSVDGVLISGVISYLSLNRPEDFESVELLSATEAMHQYGLSAGGDDTLVLWTRGRGPWAKPGRSGNATGLR